MPSKLEEAKVSILFLISLNCEPDKNKYPPMTAMSKTIHKGLMNKPILEDLGTGQF